MRRCSRVRLTGELFSVNSEEATITTCSVAVGNTVFSIELGLREFQEKGKRREEGG
jgi:hypothetical protein